MDLDVVRVLPSNDELLWLPSAHRAVLNSCHRCTNYGFNRRMNCSDGHDPRIRCSCWDVVIGRECSKWCARC